MEETHFAGRLPLRPVDVVFYDRSDDPADVLTEVILVSSTDGGSSFVVTTVSATAFDSRIGFGSAQCPGEGTAGPSLAGDPSPVAVYSPWAWRWPGGERRRVAN